jgi:hypothetical protein
LKQLGYIKGVGRLYQQTAIDTYSNVGFAKLYLEKTSLSAADFLNDRVLPFYDGYGVRVLGFLRTMELSTVAGYRPILTNYSYI